MPLAAGCETSTVPKDSKTLRKGGNGLRTAALDPANISDVEENGAQLIDLGTGAVRVRLAPTTRLPGTGGFPIARKPPAVESADVFDRDRSRTELIARAAAASPTTTFSITFSLLGGPEMDWAGFRRAHDRDGKRALVDARRAALADVQRPFIQWLISHSVTEIEPHWAVNDVRAVVRADLVADALRHPSVKDGFDEIQSAPGAAWSGAQSKSAVRTDQLYAVGATGIDGSGSTLPPRIKIGIIEAGDPVTNGIARTHVGWKQMSSPI